MTNFIYRERVSNWICVLYRSMNKIQYITERERTHGHIFKRSTNTADRDRMLAVLVLEWRECVH